MDLKRTYAKMDFKPLISVISTFKPIKLNHIDREILLNIFEKNYSSFSLKNKFKNSPYQRDYSKINLRLKKLEAANLIERTGESSKRNAINYKITNIGLIFFYADIYPSFGAILKYNKDILFKTLVFQFFEKQTILDIYHGNTNNTNSFQKIDENEDLAVIYEKILESYTNNKSNDDDSPLIQYLIINYLRNCCKLILNFCNDFFNGLSKSREGVNVEYHFRGVKLPNKHVIRRYIEYLETDESILDQNIINEIKRYQNELNEKNKALQSDKQLIDSNNILNDSEDLLPAEYFYALYNIGYEHRLFPKSKFLVNKNSPPYPLNFNRIDLTEQLEWEIKSFFLKIITKNLPSRFSNYDNEINNSYFEITSFLMRDNKFKKVVKKIKDEFEEGSRYLI